MKVIVLQGVPGSGKSTYAKKLEGAVICSADHYFVKLGEGTYKFDPAHLPKAHGECLREFVGALQSKKSLVVVDNTNTTSEEVAPYMQLANAYGYEAEIVRIEGDPSVCAQRNTHGVSVQKVLEMAARIATFKKPPYWKLVTV